MNFSVYQSVLESNVRPNLAKTVSSNISNRMPEYLNAVNKQMSKKPQWMNEEIL